MKVLCCVMFKNEEEILKRCLDSVKDYVDDYLLVDTGSTDKSISIAKEYTENVHEVEFEDFVITKNKVLEIAEGMEDFDFILWMDADEYLSGAGEDKVKFKTELDKMKQGEYTMLITNIQDRHNNVLSLEYSRPRVWVNHHDIRFVGPGIHEYVPYTDSAKTVPDIKIIHKHKTKGKNYQQTVDFYLEVLHKYYDKNPKDLRCLFYLARTYFERKDKKCLRYYEEYRQTAIEVNYVWQEEYWYTYYDEGRLYTQYKEYDKAIEVLTRAIEYYPERAEAYALLGEIYHYQLKKPFEAKKVLEKAVSLEVKDDMILFVDHFAFKYKIWDTLSLVYWETQEYKKGRDLILKLLDLPQIRQYDPKRRIDTNLPWYENKLKDIESIGKAKHYDINDYFDNIFCINLEKRTDRWDRVKRKFDQFGIAYERLRGYDGELLEKFINKDKLVLRTGGYIGCLLSHLEAIKISYNRGYKNVLILEDDLAIHKNLHEEFEIMVNEIEQKGHTNWDILYLGHASFYENYNINDPNPSTFTAIQNEKRDGKVWEAVDSWTCHARAINRKMMKWILDYYDEHGYEYEIDRLIASEVQGNPDFKCLAVYPQLFVQNDVISDNDESGRSANHFDRFLNEAYSTREDYI